MMGTFGFSYVGLVYLLLLFIPNLIWTRFQPLGYSPAEENVVLKVFEKVGQVTVTVIVLIFSDFNLKPWSLWSIWLIISFTFMMLYEIAWIRYFVSHRTLKDFYRSFLFVPVPLATLPILGFLFLGIYGQVIWLVIAVVVLGIGHIGIHIQHLCEIDKNAEER
jgi:hypothetical protein